MRSFFGYYDAEKPVIQFTSVAGGFRSWLIMEPFYSAVPGVSLRPFVKAFAQRNMDFSNRPTRQRVPARVEPVLEFQLAERFGLQVSGWLEILVPQIVIAAPQYVNDATVHFAGRVISFAVFFRPSGFTRLFHIPISDPDISGEASDILGGELRSVWNQLGDCNSFQERVLVMESFLLSRLARNRTADRVLESAETLLSRQGNVRITELARVHAMSLREFERRFLRQMGLPPKRYATICRFQSALDLKIRHPNMSWLDVALRVGYHDQMHLVHAFKEFAGGAHGSVLAQVTGIRPQAVIDADLDL